MLSLMELLEKERLFLLDGCVTIDEEAFSESIYPANDFSYIRASSVKAEIIQYEFLLSALKHKNTRTILEVANEIKGNLPHIGNKISYVPKPGKKNLRYIGRKKHEARCNTRDKMINLQEVIYEAYILAKQKDIFKDAELRVDKEKRDIIFKMLEAIGSRIQLKPRKFYEHGGSTIEKSRLSDTDEKLAATLLYLSLYSQGACLVTGDTDFARILPVASGLLEADDFMPYNEDFRLALQHNPFRLYLFDVDERAYHLAVNSRNITYQKFELFDKPAETEAARQEILELWERLGLRGSAEQGLKVSTSA